jgi:UDP-glucose:(heptosyl)LPS alpha-1,3-glucosyltransferase
VIPVTPVFPAAELSGGVEQVTWRLLQYLGDRGRFVGRFLAPHPAGTRWTVVPSGGPAWLSAARFRRDAAAGVARARAAGELVVSMGVECPPGDVYWVHSVHRAFVASSGPVTWRGHGVPSAARFALPHHRVLLALERDYFRRHRPRLVLATSPREVDDLHRWYGVPPDAVRVVPNGVDTDQYSPSRREHQRAQARQAAGMAGDELSLLFPANELHRKGFPLLVDAVAALRPTSLRIDVIGSVDEGEARAVARRAGVAAQLHLHGRVRDPSPWYAAADALVLPTWYEPFGIVLVEGLACGLPVVTTARAGAAPVVASAGGVVLDRPDDLSSLVDALRSLLDAQQRQQLAAGGPAAAAEISWPRVLRRVDELLESVA